MFSLRTKPRAAAAHARSGVTRLSAPLAERLAWAVSRRGAADVALFHDLLPSPTGGGSQFLRALVGEWRLRGIDVELGRISGHTPACLFNSYNFDASRLRRHAREGVRMVHRVDGPIGTYRGSGDAIDRRIAGLNAELAQVTILQSEYSFSKHRELGLELVSPVVIRNAPDPALFYPPGEREPLEGRPLRVIASSWSDNPRKGADALRWLDEHLDVSRFTLTFVGRTALAPSRTRLVGPLPSMQLAELLRTQDVYLAPSLDDPCSNALLEALACGLPAVYRRSGGHPELVGQAGVAFAAVEELEDAFEQVAVGLDGFRDAIVVPQLADVADRYLDVLGLDRG